MDEVLVTGATGVIGRSLVASLLKTGARVIAVSRSSARLEQLRSELDADTDLFFPLVADLSKQTAVEDVEATLNAKRLSPTGLVNGARNLDDLRSERDGIVSRENFLRLYLIDVVVAYELSLLIAARDGSRLNSIVNVGSQYGSVAVNPALYRDPAQRSPIHYGVSKAALEQLTRELAVQLAPDVRVNCVAFGGVPGRIDPEFEYRYARFCPMRRMLRTDEVAGPIMFLLSSESTSMTGHVMAADGGWTAW